MENERKTLERWSAIRQGKKERNEKEERKLLNPFSGKQVEMGRIERKGMRSRERREMRINMGGRGEREYIQCIVFCLIYVIFLLYSFNMKCTYVLICTVWNTNEARILKKTTYFSCGGNIAK